MKCKNRLNQIILTKLSFCLLGLMCITSSPLKAAEDRFETIEVGTLVQLGDLGAFKVEELLGIGAGAKVFRVTQNHTSYALKVAMELSTEMQRWADFFLMDNDARALKTLSEKLGLISPEVIFVDAERGFMLREYFPGPLLSDLLERPDKISNEEWKVIRGELKNIVDQQENSSLIIMDLKPINIIYRPQMSPRLVIFDPGEIISFSALKIKYPTAVKRVIAKQINFRELIDSLKPKIDQSISECKILFLGLILNQTKN